VIGYATAGWSDVEVTATAVGAPAWWNRSWVAACIAASSRVKGPPLSWHTEHVMVVLAELVIMSFLE
jgi:hypothetical protein